METIRNQPSAIGSAMMKYNKQQTMKRRFPAADRRTSTMAKFCMSCGKQLDETEKFCASCGAQQQALKKLFKNINLHLTIHHIWRII